MLIRSLRPLMSVPHQCLAASALRPPRLSALRRPVPSLSVASFSTSSSSSSQYFSFDEKEDELQFARTDYDCYKILGLKANASLDEVKASFRNLARKYHPDSRTQELAQSSSPPTGVAAMRAQVQNKKPNIEEGLAREEMSRRQQEANL